MKVPVQVGVPGCNNAICGCVKVEPFTVIFTIRVLATNLNHIPLLVPAVKQDGGANVPAMPVLSYAVVAEQPLDETAIAVEQSSPGAAFNAV